MQINDQCTTKSPYNTKPEKNYEHIATDALAETHYELKNPIVVLKKLKINNYDDGTKSVAKNQYKTMLTDRVGDVRRSADHFKGNLPIASNVSEYSEFVKQIDTDDLMLYTDIPELLQFHRFIQHLLSSTVALKIITSNLNTTHSSLFQLSDHSFFLSVCIAIFIYFNVQINKTGRKIVWKNSTELTVYNEKSNEWTLLPKSIVKSLAKLALVLNEMQQSYSLEDKWKRTNFALRSLINQANVENATFSLPQNNTFENVSCNIANIDVENCLTDNRTSSSSYQLLNSSQECNISKNRTIVSRKVLDRILPPPPPLVRGNVPLEKCYVNPDKLPQTAPTLLKKPYSY